MDFSLGASTGDLRNYDQSLLKQCRSVSDIDDHTAMDGSNNNNSRKLSRTDSYLSCRKQQQQPNDSLSPDENPIAQLGSNDQHLIMSSHLNQVSAAAMRQLPYQQQQQQQQQQHQLYSFKQTQGHSFGMAQYYPFTASQWAELEHQALIFKYMMARVPVPPELLNPIRRSVAAAIGPHNLIPLCNIGGSWGGFQLGVSSSPLDIEPGRCRRTDGKKWRCSRPVVPEQKYCERHMHRGRDRSKKAQEAAAAAQSRNGVGTGTGLLKSTSSPAFQCSMKGLSNNNSNGGGGGVSIGGKMFATFSMPGMAVSMEAGAAGAAGGGLSSHSHLPASTLSASQSNKDQRFLNAMSKAHLDLRPEQLLYSEPEVSGSTRELAPVQGHHPSHLTGNCSSKLSSAPMTTAMQQQFTQQQQYKSMMGYDSGMESLQELGSFAPEQQQQQRQQHAARSIPLIRGTERKPEALRHFFDDWPRATKDQLSWSDTDDSHAKLNSSSTTQLSGSRNSSEYGESPTTAANARAESSAMFSPLKLALEDTSNEDQDGGVPYTSIGLTSVRHRAPWFGNTSGDGSGSNPAAGGPLAEALQNPSNAKAPPIGFNLLGGERRNQQQQQQHHVAASSPTGVLQKMACFSDCSSSASSPGSVKTEANNPHSLAN